MDFGQRRGWLTTRRHNMYKHSDNASTQQGRLLCPLFERHQFKPGDLDAGACPLHTFGTAPTFTACIVHLEFSRHPCVT